MRLPTLVLVACLALPNHLLAQGLPWYAPINPVTLSRSGLYFQPYQDVRPGGWRTSLSVDYASTIELNRPPDAQYVLDSELLRVNLHVVRDLGRSTFLLADVSAQGAYGGFLDGFLNGYHRLLGIAIPERELRPENRFAATIVLPDGTMSSLAPSDAFLGDLRVGVGVHYSRRLQSVFSVTLPTATGPAGYGRGTLSLDAVHTFRAPLGRLVYEGSLGAGYTPAHGVLSPYQREFFVSASSGLRLRFAGRLSAFGNVYYGSPSYHNTTLRALDRRELSFDFGWLLDTKSGREWRIGLTEDLEPSGPAIDLIFRLGGSW